jgi:hypothetical protein
MYVHTPVAAANCQFLTEILVVLVCAVHGLNENYLN